MWLVGTLLSGTATEHFHHHRQFYWVVLEPVLSGNLLTVTTKSSVKINPILNNPFQSNFYQDLVFQYQGAPETFFS